MFGYFRFLRATRAAWVLWLQAITFGLNFFSIWHYGYLNTCTALSLLLGLWFVGYTIYQYLKSDAAKDGNGWVIEL